MAAATDPSEDYLVHYFGLAYYKWILVSSIGGFLALFLVLFQPFGVSNYDPRFSIDRTFLLSMLAIGLVVSAALAINEFILRPAVLPAPSRWQIVAWLAWVYVLVATVAFLFYNFLGDWHDLKWSSLFEFIRDVGMVISFPIAGFIFYIRHESLRSRFIHLSSSPPAAPATRRLHLASDNGKDVLTLASGDLLYLESQDNYLAVVYLDNGIRRSHLIRSNLKRIEELSEPQLVRCHRSFVVNLQRVRSCRGNRHGLQLGLEGSDQSVPVSRGYTEEVLRRLGAPTPA